MRKCIAGCCCNILHGYPTLASERERTACVGRESRIVHAHLCCQMALWSVYLQMVERECLVGAEHFARDGIYLQSAQLPHVSLCQSALHQHGLYVEPYIVNPQPDAVERDVRWVDAACGRQGIVGEGV